MANSLFGNRTLLHEPRFENGIRLNHANKDSYGNPSVQIEYSLSAADRKVTAQMLSAVQDALRASNLEPSQPTESTSGVRPPGSGNHETGTCRMGEDPHTSATNRYGQIHGIAGLYVADNSVIPYAGAANPTLTSAALAIRTADYISGQEA
ncbi:GMC oxidoreductase [Paenibacillus vietnamensis]|uniref:GMC oxidoreductase n=1 Tax=Paenibacillus vietnamensis TaxID=2590547 RepID=UPI001CD0FD63|nr:GMC family oxidoreductase [Paenibacillus vietnamensis]